MKYIRVDENNVVVEIFPYDPFEWIPNGEFLAGCRTLADGVEVDYYWAENEDGTYSPPDPSELPEPESKYTREEMDEFLEGLMEGVGYDSER